VLFAVPLSLFTLALAFVFGDLPGMMSLAWMLEATILYLVYTRIRDDRIYFAACLVFGIGIIRQISLIDSFISRDYISLGILIIMMASVFVSLYILRNTKSQIRQPYDILHIIALLIIGAGIAQIIPPTGHGWSIFVPAVFLLILSSVYQYFGRSIHHIFLNILLGGLCFSFIARFDALDKEIIPLMIQSGALILILIVGYLGYQSRTRMGSINLGIALCGFLIISSLYIDHFFGVFAVSLYLAIIATASIIRGILLDNPRLRTLGLYIGIFVLIKIL